jgi:hypothetical protein
MRLIIGIVEADSAIPVPYVSGRQAAWSLYDTNTAPLAARIEAALPCELTGDVVAGNESRYALSGEIDGIAVVIEAWTSDMAEKRVTGTRTVEDVEWVRLPVAEQNETTEETP